MQLVTASVAAAVPCFLAQTIDGAGIVTHGNIFSSPGYVHPMVGSEKCFVMQKKYDENEHAEGNILALEGVISSSPPSADAWFTVRTPYRPDEDKLRSVVLVTCGGLDLAPYAGVSFDKSKEFFVVDLSDYQTEELLDDFSNPV